jgi:UDP-2,3-diacylglucosamine pyrophosphatase LpxH
MHFPDRRRTGRRHTAIVSDVHLSQTHPDDPRDPLWMRYRRAEFHPDRDFASLVDHLLAERGADAIELVYNGDVFDFDAPWVKDGTSSFEEFPLTDEGCAEHVRRIIADHPVWFRATARLLVAGHRLLVLSGNHDVELYWPGVRRAIREELVALCKLEAKGAPIDGAAIAERIRFRAWFHRTEDGIYIEHGSQYDIFNGVHHAMLPLTRARDWIHPQMGKLAFKRTGSRMGYFNPYYEETFYLGFTGYMRHFWAFYARSHRHIIRTWFWGAVRTVAEIWRHRHREDWRDEARALARAETGASDEAIDATQALVARPAEDWMIPILRELWLDRLAILAILAAVTIPAWLLGGAALARYVLGAMAALVVLYEIFVPKPDIRTYDSAPPAVKRLFEIHQVRALCMGHTHRPSGVWEDRGGELKFHGNSGSWSPAFRDQQCTQPVLPARPLLLLTSEDGALWGGLHFWDGQALTADPAASREPPSEPAEAPDPAPSRASAAEAP